MSCFLVTEPEPPAVSIRLDPVVSYLTPGGTTQIRVDAVDASKRVREETGARFVSSDASIATVTSTGVISAKAIGTTTIQVRVDSLSASVPIVVVPDFGLPLTSVYAALESGGAGTACALDIQQRAYCWGDNGEGQIGDGSTDRRITPVAVAGNLRFRALALGRAFTCGLAVDNAVWCWGDNSVGQLGDETTVDRLTPTRIAGGHSFIRIVAGSSHACALTTEGQALCWGSNRAGQLGVASAATNTMVPRAVLTSVRFESLSTHYAYWMGDHYGSGTCGITREGKLWCWGEALPDGTKAIRYTPVDVSAPVPLRSLMDAGYRYSGGYVQAVYYCGVDGQRALWCATGRGPYSSSSGSTWQKQTGIKADVLLTPGGYPCWIDASRQVVCAAGRNGTNSSQLITGSDTVRAMPTTVSGALGAAGLFSIDVTGRLFEWDVANDRPRLIVVR